jgi:hypothetical protein
VHIVASEAAARLIEESGGDLYVWPKKPRCCGGVTYLAASSSPPAHRDFRRAAATPRFAVHVPAGLARLPDELHLEARRFPHRVEAYWDGCAWVV